MNVNALNNLSPEQAQTLLNAIIDLTQSDHTETARRARSALFDADLIHGNDAGIAECRELWEANAANLKG